MTHSRPGPVSYWGSSMSAEDDEDAATFQYRWRHAIRTAILGDARQLAAIVRGPNSQDKAFREDLALFLEGRLYVPPRGKGRPATPIAVALGRLVNRNTPVKRAADRYRRLAKWIAERSRRGMTRFSHFVSADELKARIADREGVDVEIFINHLRRPPDHEEAALQRAIDRELLEDTYYERR